MGLLKKLFGKEKQKESFSEKQLKQREVKSKLDSVFKDKRNKVCKCCEEPILDSERYVKQGGFFWHKKCYNKTKVLAKKTM